MFVFFIRSSSLQKFIKVKIQTKKTSPVLSLKKYIKEKVTQLMLRFTLSNKSGKYSRILINNSQSNNAVINRKYTSLIFQNWKDC